MMLPNNPTARYRKARARIGGNGRAWSRPAESIGTVHFDLKRPVFNTSSFRVGERNTKESGHVYFCPACRRRATYLIKRPATAAHSWECQDCTDAAHREGRA